MYKKLFRPLLFRIDPEIVHTLVCLAFRLPLLSKIFKVVFNFHSPELEREVCGIRFKNPVGLAAGFDKNAELVKPMTDLGFGFVEIGTVTPKGQLGNNKPRIFRLPNDQALINRMGFNNSGVDRVRKNLLRSKGRCIVGGNIGKNKITSNENAVDDYIRGFNQLYDVVDYFVVNVSSPNTPGLRELQEASALTKILDQLQDQNNLREIQKPIFLKISPDLNTSQLDDIIGVVLRAKIAGVIATNTTIDRGNLKTSREELEKVGAGGLSGQPIKESSTEIIRYIAQKSKKAFPIIGVGGIQSPEDALEKLKAGASLIQIYTGFIYEGPGLIKRINKYLTKQGSHTFKIE